jgi:hypothetical protein
MARIPNHFGSAGIPRALPSTLVYAGYDVCDGYYIGAGDGRRYRFVAVRKWEKSSGEILTTDAEMQWFR